MPEGYVPLHVSKLIDQHILALPGPELDDHIDWLIMSGRNPHGVHVEDDPEDFEDDLEIQPEEELEPA